MPRRKIPREFVPSDINTQFDPKVMTAGPYAELIFRRGNEHSKRANRDGVLMRSDLPVVCQGISASQRHIAALVDAGLWEEISGGWRIVAWRKWNLTEAEQAEVRAARSAAAHVSHHRRGLHETPVDECPECQKETK